jgi:hypothetical protein
MLAEGTVDSLSQVYTRASSPQNGLESRLRPKCQSIAGKKSQSQLAAGSGFSE